MWLKSILINNKDKKNFDHSIATHAICEHLLESNFIITYESLVALSTYLIYRRLKL